MPELDHISHSQIDMFIKCQKQWEFRYVEGLKLRPSGALVVGGAYHKTLEEYFKIKISTGNDLPVKDTLDMYSDVWNTKLAAEDPDWREDNPGKLKTQGAGLVEAYRLKQALSMHPIAVEDWYEAEIGGTKIVGSRDMIMSETYFGDHKTSARAYSQDDVDKHLQASAHAWVAKQPIDYFFHVALKHASPRIQVLHTKRGYEDIIWWLVLAKAVIQQMKSGVYIPNPTGWWCSPAYCGYWDLCRGKL